MNTSWHRCYILLSFCNIVFQSHFGRWCHRRRPQKHFTLSFCFCNNTTELQQEPLGAAPSWRDCVAGCVEKLLCLTSLYVTGGGGLTPLLSSVSSPPPCFPLIYLCPPAPPPPAFPVSLSVFGSVNPVCCFLHHLAFGVGGPLPPPLQLVWALSSIYVYNERL